MSAPESIAGLLAALGLLVALVGLAVQFHRAIGRVAPRDVGVPKGSPAEGVWYAFSLGMAPWAKESTRRHWKGYLRGIVFHAGIFTALAALVTSPWLGALPLPARTALAVVTGLGAIAGLGGMFARWSEESLRAISTGDDHLAVLLVTLFLALTTAALLSAGMLVAWYLVSAVLLAYVPLSKIRHFLFFFFARWYFGRLFGRRGVVRLARQHP